jgi:ribosomal protein S18
MAKIFVGNFPFSVNDEKLREFFGRIGTVISGKVMTEGEGGRSRGFGFVEFSTAEEAQRAISELNGTLWEGRQIKVSEDRGQRPRRPDGDGDGHHHGGDRPFGGYGERSSQPMGYFRAQPLDLGTRRKKKADPFLEDPTLQLDYKDARLLKRFVSERGKILPRRMTGLTAHNQRQVARAIKRAQHLAIMSPVQG